MSVNVSFFRRVMNTMSQKVVWHQVFDCVRKHTQESSNSSHLDTSNGTSVTELEVTVSAFIFTCRCVSRVFLFKVCYDFSGHFRISAALNQNFIIFLCFLSFFCFFFCCCKYDYEFFKCAAAAMICFASTLKKIYKKRRSQAISLTTVG